MAISKQEFHDAVLYILGQIPKGKVTTYGKIAKMAGFPSHARYVGKLLSQLPQDSKLPWYRVINGQGRISFSEDSERYITQKSLLEQEGISFLNGKVNLKIHQWCPE
ncbi:MGMT family protein [Litoribrevibacter albus]|uniref:Mgmt family protein n=1 Tax=Litoribrevibacter albus TaxID=1473156 RepID=A0AA37S7K7_9GAMM|nr:MGMT family protein [Litoribrevibacter albus]GLQ29708.1 mgmt family protein [Litoribrevibacter albus]